MYPPVCALLSFAFASAFSLVIRISHHRRERNARRVTLTTARAPYDLAINSICITRRGSLMNKVIRISVLITPRNTIGAVSANKRVRFRFPFLSKRTTGILTSYRKFRSFRPFNAVLGRLITSTILADAI